MATATTPKTTRSRAQTNGATAPTNRIKGMMPEPAAEPKRRRKRKRSKSAPAAAASPTAPPAAARAAAPAPAPSLAVEVPDTPAFRDGLPARVLFLVRTKAGTVGHMDRDRELIRLMVGGSGAGSSDLAALADAAAGFGYALCIRSDLPPV